MERPLSSDEQRLRAALEERLLDDPSFAPDRSQLHRALALGCHPSTSRTWVNKWVAEVRGRHSTSGFRSNTVQLELQGCSLGSCLVLVGGRLSRIGGCRIWSRLVC